MEGLGKHIKSFGVMFAIMFLFSGFVNPSLKATAIADPEDNSSCPCTCCKPCCGQAKCGMCMRWMDMGNWNFNFGGCFAGGCSSFCDLGRFMGNFTQKCVANINKPRKASCPSCGYPETDRSGCEN